MIRTPDQRLRVFISSTIQELAEERLAARKAIEELHLTPVLFEIGARPYPPREVYQAYLSQSDIFIGIYWNSYGWVAPDMEISGLEDEYLLSHDKPRLIYIKKSDQRQERLKTLINNISNAGISYKTFSEAKELQELIENDLALLLSEQFFKESSVPSEAKPVLFKELPVPYHPLVGREIEIAEITSLVVEQKIRLVTLLGMGGTGKTRLAIELSHKMLRYFKHGVVFTNLSAIQDHTRIPATIAHQMGLTDGSVQSVVETLISFLSDKELLLVLDNFEQLVDGAEILSKILGRARDVQILVTSRRPLYLRAEYIYPLYPLDLPDEHCAKTLEAAMRVPSVSLFIQRARSINPRLPLDFANLQAICTLCERLGGLPLAIELAAMRTRHMSPSSLLSGMEKTLDILSGGARDLPDRQQSFRATIDWSYGLLTDNEKALFRLASIFQDGWTIEALTVVSNTTPGECTKITEQLLDAGLIRLHIDDLGKTRYDMLQPIEEYAEELMEQDPVKEEAEERFLNFYIKLCSQIDSLQLVSEQHRNWITTVTTEYENFRQAFLHALKTGKKNHACRIIYTISIFWFREALQNEGLRWIAQADIHPPQDWKTLATEDIRPLALANLISGSFKFFPADFKGCRHDLSVARELFEWIGLRDGMARCDVYLGLVAISTGDQAGMQHFLNAIENGTASGDIYSRLLSSTFIAEIYAVQGRFDEAKEWLDKSLILLAESNAVRSYSLELEDLSAIVYLERGNVHLAMGDLQTAKKSFQQSIESFEKQNAKSTKGYAILSFGIIALREGDYETSKQVGLSALNASRETGDPIISLMSLRCLCAYLLMKGKLTQSIQFLREVDAHITHLQYSAWSVDVVFQVFMEEEFKKHQIEYTRTSTQEPKLSFDTLIAQVTKAVEDTP